MPADIACLILTPPISAAGLWLYDRDYRLYGRTHAAGVVGVLVAFFMPALALHFSTPFFPTPARPIQVVGYALFAGGILTALAIAAGFRSARQVVGLHANRLSTSGPYRFSRNPQYVLTFVAIAGYAMTGRSAAAWLAVGLFALVLHFTVVVEERHLASVFGEEYETYKSRTPRYLVL